MTDVRIIKKQINDVILQQIIDAIGGCDINNGPWIAGGTARRLWFNEPWGIQDIDLFFPNEQIFSFVENKLDQMYYDQNQCSGNYNYNSNPSVMELSMSYESCSEISMYSTQNAKTYKLKIADALVCVQIIRKNWYRSIFEVWDNFDLTVCKFATDGKIIIAEDDAVEDCNTLILRVNPRCNRKVNVRRVIKYSIYGFNTDRDTMRDILERYNEKTLNEGSDDDYT